MKTCQKWSTDLYDQQCVRINEEYVLRALSLVCISETRSGGHGDSIMAHTPLYPEAHISLYNTFLSVCVVCACGRACVCLLQETGGQAVWNWIQWVSICFVTQVTCDNVHTCIPIVSLHAPTPTGQVLSFSIFSSQPPQTLVTVCTKFGCKLEWWELI